jgi:hypothetical protein
MNAYDAGSGSLLWSKTLSCQSFFIDPLVYTIPLASVGDD